MLLKYLKSWFKGFCDFLKGKKKAALVCAAVMLIRYKSQVGPRWAFFFHLWVAIFGDTKVEADIGAGKDSKTALIAQWKYPLR